jgi:hypothetical protein
MLKGGVRDGNESWMFKSLVCLEASGSRSLQKVPDGQREPDFPNGLPVLE